MSWLGKKIYNFLNRKWFFDKIYNEYFGQFFFKFGYSISYKFVDRGIFEILGPTGLSSTALIVGSSLHYANRLHIPLHFVYFNWITLLFGLRQLWLIFDFFIDYRIFILIILLFFF
jgi:hypothetical protein